MHAANDPIRYADATGTGKNKFKNWGKFKVDRSCDEEACRDVRPLLDKEPPELAKQPPKPGSVEDVDGVYWPGNILKIPDNCKVTMYCTPSGSFLRRDCFGEFYRKPQHFRKGGPTAPPNGWLPCGLTPFRGQVDVWDQAIEA